MIDLPPDLKRQVDAILAKLSVLSEAPGQKMNEASPAKRARAEMRPGKTWADHDPSRTPSYESREPPGTRESRSKRPSADFDSIYDWFKDRLTGARSAVEIQRLCIIAEAKHAVATGRVKAPLAMAASSETTKMRDKRIATDSDYLGVPPEWVAAAESFAGHVTAENVRRVRLAASRDAITGHPLPMEHALRGKARHQRARELDLEGIPVREVARRFGVSHSTVLGWLGRRGEEAA